MPLPKGPQVLEGLQKEKEKKTHINKLNLKIQSQISINTYPILYYKKKKQNKDL